MTTTKTKTKTWYSLSIHSLSSRINSRRSHLANNTAGRPAQSGHELQLADGHPSSGSLRRLNGHFSPEAPQRNGTLRAQEKRIASFATRPLFINCAPQQARVYWQRRRSSHTHTQQTRLCVCVCDLNRPTRRSRAADDDQLDSLRAS